MKNAEKLSKAEQLIIEVYDSVVPDGSDQDEFADVFQTVQRIVADIQDLKARIQDNVRHPK